MYSENVSGVTCTDLPSTGVKPGYQGINAQISQIPGLSQTIISPPDEKARGRRSGVLESDSDFVKLSKQGGHKGLLWHEEIMTSKPEPYKAAGWFCTAPGHEPSEEEKNPGAFQPAEPPFGTDNMSTWERDDSSSNGKEKNNNVHYIPTARESEKPQPSNQYYEKKQFKRITFGKNESPVDMSKLLSFGYAEDNKPTDNIDLSN
ncbi:uncharacterized protein C7orf57 homolog [Anarrhichthys ocellatus]|uniref:uncharacterized protein C7orf57 homolog n=1 Tax=Anarrhichthys ocellatus TaxID=433405 RepID=UPI0012ECBF04|nr:uncharacterized protein C7orf57 homolog [Anarrhichthys ocellatus]